MRRKGYDPKVEEIPAVLQIHNVVNEQGWAKIKEWERMRGNLEPKLIKFEGRPKDFSPKAWINMHILQKEAPFDRHDWKVDRNGKEVRYVIDFYRGNSAKVGSPLSIYLDVRPALDSVPAILDRLSYWARTVFRPHSLPKKSLTYAESDYRI
eukprot:gene38141-47081_t